MFLYWIEDSCALLEFLIETLMEEANPVVIESVEFEYRDKRITAAFSEFFWLIRIGDKK